MGNVGGPTEVVRRKTQSPCTNWQATEWGALGTFTRRRYELFPNYVPGGHRRDSDSGSRRNVTTHSSYTYLDDEGQSRNVCKSISVTL